MSLNPCFGGYTLLVADLLIDETESLEVLILVLVDILC